MTTPAPGSGLEPKPYWVNYRTGKMSAVQSPLDLFHARRRIRAARTEGRPVDAMEAEQAQATQGRS